MIKPEAIPQYTGDLGQLEKDHASLTKDAGHIRETGSSVHTQFQALSAYYRAPEAEQLFASTKPVKDRADTFADDLEKVATSLSDYATEIRPLVTKLAQLKTDATTFVNENKDDDEWEYDGDKVEEHNQLRDDITATVAAFWAAERTCHNKITALFGGTQMVAGDGSERKDQYGFNAEDLKNAKLPWGDPVEEKHHWYEVGHWVKSFVWDGLIVDGVWGTIKGLGTLVGFGGWEAMGQAWKGLAQLATGLVISAVPGAGALFWTLPDDKLPSWLRDSRTAMKETGKALVAWDEWGKNPGRAAGAVTFNVLTTVFTGGAGGAAAGAGKAGAVAKVLSVAGKTGKFIDPMTYIAKGAGSGLSKIGDITKGLKGIENIEIPKLPDNAVTLPDGSTMLPDGTFHLPDGAKVPDGGIELPNGTVKFPDDAPVLPEGTTKLPTAADDPIQYVDRDGNLLGKNGDVVQHAKDAPSPDNLHTDLPVREPALVGAHTADNVGHVGDDAFGGTNRPADQPAGNGSGHGGDTPQEPTPPHGDGPSEPERLPDDGPGEPHTPDSDGHQPSPDGPDNHPTSGIDDGPHVPGRDDADMGTRRDYEARSAPESTIPAPPKQPGDLILDTGDPVYFQDGRTAIGYDKNTLVNYDLVEPLPGHHDVVVHGNDQGFFEPGRVNESGVPFSAGDTHPTHIADAIRANPSYNGGPVRLVSCHTGTTAKGVLDVPAAQAIANELGVPVKAPTNKVGVSGRLGPGQTPTIFGGGYWRTFLPLAR